MNNKHGEKYTLSNDSLPYDEEYYYDDEPDGDYTNEELGVIPFAAQNAGIIDSGDESFTGLPYIHEESRRAKKDGRKKNKNIR
ncbi:MAG: hypothetical protein IKS19_08425 [Clostridia bacterium]|nr:hypothetical protein [Clostridia bacterium]